MKYLLYVVTDDINTLVDYINICDYCYQVEPLDSEEEQLELDFSTTAPTVPSMYFD